MGWPLGSPDRGIALVVAQGVTTRTVPPPLAAAHRTFKHRFRAS